MAKHIVTCRVCKQQFDTNAGKEGIDWCKPRRNFYYHVPCYENWKNKTKDINGKASDEMWYDSLVEFLYHDMKMSVNFSKLQNQWESFIKKGKTAKGIYFAARYYFDYKKGDIGKSEGGIGIIPYIYEESCQYWASRELREQGICAKIEQQLRERLEQKRIVIDAPKAKEKKKDKSVDWSIIDSMEEDVEC